MDLLTVIHEPIRAVREELQRADLSLADWSLVSDQLLSLSEAASEASRPEAARLARVLHELTQSVPKLVQMQVGDSELRRWLQFCDQGLDSLETLLLGDEPATTAIRDWLEEATLRCAEVQTYDDEVSLDKHSWCREHEERPVQEESNSVDLSATQIGLILQSLTSGTEPSSPRAESSFPQRAATEVRGEIVPPVLEDMRLDPEMLEAYLDDGQRCLSEIETALLTFEDDPSNRAPLNLVCRELHTLKGASASVGLHSLAHYLHEVEDALQSACDQGGAIDVQPILMAVDTVREQMGRCGDPAAPAQVPTTSTGTTNDSEQNRTSSSDSPLKESAHRAPTADRFVDAGPSGQDYVRVRSAQLDRLMDMLAELVMLRNRRESRVERLREVHSEIVRCVSRLRAYDESTGRRPQASSTNLSEANEGRERTSRQRVSSLTEIANDLLDLGSGLRELYEPVADENLAISRFIRQFRQEMIQLRRVPIAGLFQRLQRSARDAARSEAKQVRVVLSGEDVGLETALQQQLYEPLLHIVRNAVSHGVESEAVRAAQGKSPIGTVTLEAHGSANLLVITVRDDGGGLDYDALRRRGLERGLISRERATSRAELARLIFHPGFSTRDAASEISGRGVGMDVVAVALERMHGWIDVDSTPGHGTSVRLLIPLHSVIEHVMVFRVGGQDFAIPTTSVETAGTGDAWEHLDFPLVPFARVFPQMGKECANDSPVIVLAQSDGQPSDATNEEQAHVRRLGLLVDEIVGPEEVVVRSLPGLLQQQRLFSGVTLAGTGDIMLLFNSQQLMELGQQVAQRRSTVNRAPSTLSSRRPTRRALIVDDSRSARRLHNRILTSQGFACEEASDGLQALRMLREDDFDIVFTDLEMPQMGGLDLLREIKNQPHTAHLPVVMISSRSDDAFRQTARGLGVMDFLVKPVSELSLAPVLERFVSTESRNPA